ELVILRAPGPQGWLRFALRGTIWMLLWRFLSPKATLIIRRPSEQPTRGVQTAILSPDGTHIWNGIAWIPVQDPAIGGQPTRSPQATLASSQLSPDGTHIWNGKQWIPLNRPPS